MKLNSSRILTLVLSWVVYLAAIGIMFREFFLSGADRIVGDIADGQLIQSIHEHWYKVFSGKEAWRNLNIFYPVDNSLGYSDTFLLQGIPYTILRWLGIERFLAFQLIQMLLATIGFWSMKAWLNRYRGIAPLLAVWGAFLFTIASPFYINIRNSHIQLLAIWLVPLILIYLEKILLGMRTGGNAPARSFLVFCFLFGGLVYSTFYTAYFLILILLLALLSAWAIVGRKDLVPLIIPPRNRLKQFIPGVLVMGAWLGLFLWTYLEVRFEMGGRSLSSVMPSIPLPWHMFNQSETNLLWGHLNRQIWDDPGVHRWSYELALPLICFLFGVIGSCLVLWRRRTTGTVPTDLAIFAGVLLLGLLISVRIGDFSLWIIPYYLVPGGDAVRVVPRFNLILLVPVIFVMCSLLQSLWTRRTILPKLLVILLVPLISLEQIQLIHHSNISRKERWELIGQAAPPPDKADAFYAAGQPYMGWHREIPHSSAMLLSQYWGIPTLNGRSGFLAKDWNLIEMDPKVSFPRVLEWAAYKDIDDHVYIYNLDTNRWLRSIDFSASADRFSMGQDLLQLPPDEFKKLAVKGWQHQEHWGVWSNKPDARIEFPPMTKTDGTVILDMLLTGFVDEQQPTSRLAIFLNGEEIAQVAFTRTQVDVEKAIPVQLPSDVPWSLNFRIIDPAKEDAFRLGVGLKSLIVRRNSGSTL